MTRETLEARAAEYEARAEKCSREAAASQSARGRFGWQQAAIGWAKEARELRMAAAEAEG